MTTVNIHHIAFTCGLIMSILVWVKNLNYHSVLRASLNMAQKADIQLCISLIENMALTISHWANYCKNMLKFVRSENRVRSNCILYFNYDGKSDHLESNVEASIWNTSYHTLVSHLPLT